MLPAERGRNRIRDVFHGQAVPRDPVAVEFDIEAGKALGLPDMDLHGAANLCHCGGKLLGGRIHRIEIIPIDRNRDFAARAADQLIEPHLDRLRHLVEISNNRRGRFLDALLHFLFGAHTGRPPVSRLQHHVIVGRV